MIVEGPAWVLEQSADHHRDWRRKGLDAPRISVDISPVQFSDRHFLEELTRATGVGDPYCGGVDLEISERVALDNFGTGPSSWRLLTGLPLDLLKIDRSFDTSLRGPAPGWPWSPR